ncbi:MAG: hypothetical protein IKM20_06735 [Erysipelotrichales bacterium]|nr:hypothetical protein [Erysipelotrichales bacterium]
MIQVKTFEETSLEELEDEINNVLDDSVEYINALYATSVVEDEIYYSAILFYRVIE